MLWMALAMPPKYFVEKRQAANNVKPLSIALKSAQSGLQQPDYYSAQASYL